MLNWQELSRQLQQIIDVFIRFAKARRRENAALGIAAILFLLAVLFVRWLPESLEAVIKVWHGHLIIPVVLGTIGVIFLIYFIYRRWQSFDMNDLPPVTNSPSAIKGPLAFTEADGELFQNLGREDELRRLLNYIEDDQVRLVVLMGASGAGKTSLLRAGLTHLLKDKGIKCHYWEAVPSDSERDLLRTIQKSWHSELSDDASQSQPPTPPTEIASLDDLINPSSELKSKHVVILDQFEQLQGGPKESMFRLLRKVARKAKPPHSVTWIVAFRPEFLFAWSEFTIGEQDRNFFPREVALHLFTPEQTRLVIKKLLDAAKIDVEEKVIDNLLQAIIVDGEVSPVEIGIGLLALSELYKNHVGQRMTEAILNYFGGGAEGLLTQYIRGCLELFLPEDREIVLKAMLSLRDPETTQRLPEGKKAGELAKELKADARRLKAQLDRLAQRDKRLLEYVDLSEKENPRYRLTHERLIPALHRLAGRLLGKIEAAREILVNAFSIWHKHRAARYLLRGKDLRFVEKYWEQISWGKDERQKRRFLKLSQRRRTLRRAIFGAFIILLVLMGASFVLLQFTSRHVTIEQDFAQRVVVRRGTPRLWFPRVIGDPILLDTGYSASDLDPTKQAQVQNLIYWGAHKTDNGWFGTTDFYANLSLPRAKERWHCLVGEAFCLESLFAALKHSDARLRRNAAYASGEAVKANPQLARQVVAQLTEVIGDANTETWMRSDAALALGEVIRVKPELGDEAKTQLKNLLAIDKQKSSTFGTVELDMFGNAAYALGKIIEARPDLADEVLETLTKLLTDIKSEPSPSLALMRRKVISALGQVVKAKPSLADELVEPLLGVLKDKEQAYTRKERADFRDSAQALGEIVFSVKAKADGQKIVTSLLRLLKDSDSYVQGNAAVALGQIAKANPKDNEEVISELLKLLEQSKHGYVNGCVSHALGEMVRTDQKLAERFVHPLTAQLDQVDAWTRENAASALGVVVKAQPALASQASTPLLKALSRNDDDPLSRPAGPLGDGAIYARRAAARAIAHVVESQPELADQFVEPLRGRLNDNFLVSSFAAAALGEIASLKETAHLKPDYIDEVFALSISEQSEKRKGAIRSLAKWLATKADSASGQGSDPIQFLFDHLEGKQSALPPNVKAQCGENANTCAVYRQIIIEAMAYRLKSKDQAMAMQAATLRTKLETLYRNSQSPLHLRIAAWDALVAAARFRDNQASDEFEGLD